MAGNMSLDEMLHGHSTIAYGYANAFARSEQVLKRNEYVFGEGHDRTHHLPGNSAIRANHSEAMSAERFHALAKLQRPRMKVLQEKKAEMDSRVQKVKDSSFSLMEIIKTLQATRPLLTDTDLQAPPSKPAAKAAYQELLQETLLNIGQPAWTSDAATVLRAEKLLTNSPGASIPSGFQPEGPEQTKVREALRACTGVPADADGCWSFAKVTEAIVKLHAQAEDARADASRVEFDSQSKAVREKAEIETKLTATKNELKAKDASLSRAESETNKYVKLWNAERNLNDEKQKKMDDLQQRKAYLESRTERLVRRLDRVNGLIDEHAGDLSDSDEEAGASSSGSDDPEAVDSREVRSRVRAKLVRLRIEADNATMDLEEAREDAAKLRLELARVEKSQKDGRQGEIDRLQTELENWRESARNAEDNSHRVSNEKDNLAEHYREVLKSLLQAYYGDYQPTAQSMSSLVQAAIPVIQQSDFGVNDGFSRPVKFADSYLDIDLPAQEDSLLIFVFLALKGKLKGNTQLHDHRVQMQWLDQVVMPETHMHGGGADGPSAVIPVLAQLILDTGIQTGIGLTRSIALWLLYGLVSHFPYQNAEKWDTIVTHITKRSLSDLDLLNQAATLRFLTCAVPTHPELVRGFVGDAILPYVQNLDPMTSVPGILHNLREMVPDKTTPEAGLFETTQDETTLMLVRTVTENVLFVQRIDETWSCSTSGASYNISDDKTASATYSTSNGNFTLSWIVGDGSGMDKYAGRDVTYTDEVESMGAIAALQKLRSRYHW